MSFSPRKTRRDARVRSVRRTSSPRFEGLECRLVPSTFTVTSTNDSGPGSLRQAILDANASPGADVVAFDIGGGGHQTITLQSPLPAISDLATIDGSTQSGFAGTPIVEIDGSNLPIDGLHLAAAGCVVRGLVVNDLGGAAVAVETTGQDFVLRGNYLGTDVTGSLSRPVREGVSVEARGTIGGTGPGEGNLISGATESGIRIYPTDAVTIQGNLIGTNAAGTGAIPNFRGILSNAVNSHALIGGTAPGAGNLISGNTESGVAARGLTVQGNKIGTDISGSMAIPNGSGVSGYDLIIGGTAPGAGNLISGNLSFGVGAWDGSLVQGNLIGTDVTGLHALGNASGVDCQNATIGGTSAGARNIISGNAATEIVLHGQNLIQGNYIGTDITGEVGLQGGAYTGGIDGRGGPNTTILNNVISLGPGRIALYEPKSAIIRGNRIGTNEDGTRVIGNERGIWAGAEYDNTIGGTSPGDGNLISGNALGILLTGYGPDNSTIQGNTITNNGWGIFLSDGPSGVLIGGTTPGTGNVIAHNGNGGVVLAQSPPGGTLTLGVSILGNSIYDNGSVGTYSGHSGGVVLLESTSLGGSDSGRVNDPQDSDTGPNGGQNYPVLTAAYAGAASAVAGTFNGAPNSTFRIEFFAGTASGIPDDPSARGQGERYLGHVDVTTDGNGDATIDASGLAASSPGEFITATATVLTGPNANSTSEFSAWVTAISNRPPTAAPAGPGLAVPGQPRVYTLGATDPDPADAIVGFTYTIDFGDGTPALTITASPNNGAGMPLTHVFTTTGSFTITLRATDARGSSSAPAALGVLVESAQIQPDPLHAGQALLAVGGTLDDDKIKVKPGPGCGEVKVVIRDDEREIFYRHAFDPAINRIAVYGQTGDDELVVNPAIDIPAWLYGGDGSDKIKGGGGPSVLLGGAGDDLLVGQGGRDILVGGTGSDKIVGSASDDILIAGSTAYDANDAALAALMAEWTSGRAYADRVRNLRGDASGPTFAARANGNVFPAVDGTYGRAVTVFDDGASDILTGDGGLDWFLFNADGDNQAKKDKATDLRAAEFADDLDFINGA